MSIKLLLNIAPALGVLVAAIALYYQILRSRFSMNLDLVLKLDERFNAADFKNIRSKASSLLLTKRTKNNLKRAEDVFDFFETLGYMVKHKALDKNIVWHTFYYWVHGYWSIGKDYILSSRQEESDKSIWEDFEWLHNELLKIERVKGKKSECELICQEKIIEFLKDEK